MFRLLLGALFFFSSVVPAFAQAFDCIWCRGHGMHYTLPEETVRQIPVYPGGMNGAFALAVVYPGLVVLMTMAARYFLGAADASAGREQPEGARNTAALSALWLVGFYPFLSTPLGGFLFLLTGIASVAGWASVRRLGMELRLTERLLVLWTFFFFSLTAGIMAAGYGRGMGAGFDEGWAALRGSTNIWGPFMLAAVNAGALWLVLNVAGITRPTDPVVVMRAKIYGVIAAIAVLDTVVMTNSPGQSWLAWPLMALPSLAYYGAYRLVSRMPETAKARAGSALFSLLALFLTLLASLTNGASAAAIFASAAAAVFALSLGRAIALLWRSGAALETKIVLSLAASAAVCGGAWLAASLQSLASEARDEFLAGTLLPALLNAPALLVFALAYGFGLYLMLAQKISLSARLALGVVMVTFLLAVLAGANLAGS